MIPMLAVTVGALPRWLHLPEGVSSYSHKIDGMFHLIMWITGVIFVIVELLLLLFLFRYRHREGRKATYTHGNNRLEVVWTIIPALICVVLALLSRRTWAEIKQEMPANALEIDVTGEQFSWTIRYAGKDGKMGTDDDIVSLNQLHFPVGKPVVATLRSKDVIHSFFLPEFRVKQDAVPGMSTRIWWDATRTGHWEIACAELCGLGHYRMKGFVTVETPEEFEAWLGSQTPAAAAPPGATAAPQEGQPAPAAMPSAAEKPNPNANGNPSPNPPAPASAAPPANVSPSAPSVVTPAAAGQEGKSTS